MTWSTQWSFGCRRRRRSTLGFLLLAFGFSSFIIFFLHCIYHSPREHQPGVAIMINATSSQTPTRKLLAADAPKGVGVGKGRQQSSGKEKKMIGLGDSCSKDDIALYQAATPPLPNGIPTYTVEILNECISGCTVSDVHLSCGWFASARLINPRVFRRLAYDDCLVNDGGGIAAGGSVSFQYANSFPYRLYVSSVECD